MTMKCLDFEGIPLSFSRGGIPLLEKIKSFSQIRKANGFSSVWADLKYDDLSLPHCLQVGAKLIAFPLPGFLDSTVVSEVPFGSVVNLWSTVEKMVGSCETVFIKDFVKYERGGQVVYEVIYSTHI